MDRPVRADSKVEETKYANFYYLYLRNISDKLELSRPNRAPAVTSAYYDYIYAFARSYAYASCCTIVAVAAMIVAYNIDALNRAMPQTTTPTPRPLA